MSNRMRELALRVVAIARTVASCVTAVVGLDEAVLLVGLALLTAGAWPFAGRAALLAPGAVLVYIALPARGPFFSGSSDGTKKERRS